MLQQPEAAVLHELAHVRRLDYLVNLLQTLVESFFYFNPFVRALGSRLRHDRGKTCARPSA